MSTTLDHIIHYVGNRSPSIFDTITVDGVAVDLTGSSVKLQARAVGASTLKIDTAAAFVTPPGADGRVRYDPAAVDVDTAGYYVGWWRVTLPGGTIQDTPEFLIEIAPHAPITNQYVSSEELKSTLKVAKSYAKIDIDDAIAAASRAVDRYCRQVFYLGPVGETRTYTPISEDYLMIDPASTITTVTVQGTAITLGTNYAKQSSNAALIGEPWSILRSLNSYVWPRAIPDSVTVLGQFGWATIPPQIKVATKIIAARYFLRPTQAVFGIAGIGLDTGSSPIADFDPDVDAMLDPFVRSGMLG